MVELNEKALEAAEVAWRASVSATCKLMLRDAIRAYLSALPEEVLFCPNCGWNSAMDGEARPASDDGLVVGWAYDLATNIIYEDGKPHYSGWEARISFNEPNVPEGSIRNLRALREASTALQSKDEQIERLTRERDEALTDPYKVMGGIYEKWKARAEAAEQQAQKLTAENERLREALSPFAERANWPLVAMMDGVPIQCQAIYPSFYTTPKTLASFGLLVSDFRAARAALETQEGEG